jgi:hypothetical protein
MKKTFVVLLWSILALMAPAAIAGSKNPIVGG